jgi:hypothetical protein
LAAADIFAAPLTLLEVEPEECRLVVGRIDVPVGEASVGVLDG